MQAGDLRHVLLIDEPVATQNETGEEVIEWVPFGKVFASIEPLRGVERASFEGIQSEVDTRIRIRWNSRLDQVTPKWRVRFKATIYNIESIINVDTTFRELQLLCSSGINDG